MTSIGSNAGGVPPFDFATLEPSAPVGHTERVMAVVAFPTVSETLYQIGAAVDCIAVMPIGHEVFGFEEEESPSDEAFAEIERKRKLKRLARGVLGSKREQIGLDSQHILARNLGEPRKR